MDSAYQKYRKGINKLILIIAVVVIAFLMVTFLLPFLAPFVIAIIIALINEPVIALLERIRVPRKIAAVISLLFTICVLGGLITIGIIKIYNELMSLQSNLSSYINYVSNQLADYYDKLTIYYNNLPKEVSGAIIENIKTLAPKLQDMVKSFANYLIGTITSIPKMTLLIIVTLLSTYFISSDRREIRGFIYKQMPDSWIKNLPGIKTNTFSALFGYFKAILILILFTFIEATSGFFIIGVNYALLLGLIVAISDIIPIVGTGIVFIPWIVWNLATGNMRIALGLTAIYVLGVIIRQVMEPKIVGSQIGLHPLVTLVAMYVGLELLGFIGMFIGPITIIVIRNLQKSGLIRLWKE